MIDLSVNFIKEDIAKELCHCYDLIVVCYEFAGEYLYSVKALAHGSHPLNIRGEFYTPEEAFAYAKKVAAANPRYGDKRDYDYKQAPFFRAPDIEVKDGENPDEKS